MTARIVVTGASGFVGRALLPELHVLGCEVLALTREDSDGPPSAVVDKVRDFAPDAVVHLATHFLATHRPDEIRDLIRANVEWGTIVAEAAVTASARFITIGTAWQHYEGRAYDPVSLYASTKQAFADIVEYYVRMRGLDAVEVTLFDTYGPGDVRPKLIPSLLGAAASGRPLELSDGHQLIDLTYVDDIVAGLVGLALAEEMPRHCILRSWRPVTIRELVDIVSSAIGEHVPVVWDARPAREREMRSDWVFGMSPPGWTARVSLDDGMRRTWQARTAPEAGA